MATLRVFATLALGVVIACGTSTSDGGGVDAPASDAASPCGPKPLPPSWQPNPQFDIECVSYCNDDRSTAYLCVDGKWVCGAGQIPVSACPCGGGLGLQPPVTCYACDGGTAFKTCDVTKHYDVCPMGTHESPCDAGVMD